MKKLNVKQKNWLVSAHVISGATWFGTAICITENDFRGCSRSSLLVEFNLFQLLQDEK